MNLNDKTSRKVFEIDWNKLLLDLLKQKTTIYSVRYVGILQDEYFINVLICL